MDFIWITSVTRYETKLKKVENCVDVKSEYVKG